MTDVGARLQPEGLEWHVMLAATGRRLRVVGVVESVTACGILITRMERGARLLRGSAIFVPWTEVVYMLMCGPDRDDDLFDEAARWREAS